MYLHAKIHITTNVFINVVQFYYGFRLKNPHYPGPFPNIFCYSVAHDVIFLVLFCCEILNEPG